MNSKLIWALTYLGVGAFFLKATVDNGAVVVTKSRKDRAIITICLYMFIMLGWPIMLGAILASLFAKGDKRK